MSIQDKIISFLNDKSVDYSIKSNHIAIADPFKSPDPGLTLRFYFDTGKCVGYRSGFKGSIYSVVKEVTGCSIGEAKRIIGESSKYSFDDIINKKEPEKIEDKSKVFFPAFTNFLLDERDSDTYRSAYKYMRDRGITDQQIFDYKIHYCWAGDFDNRIMIPYMQDGKFVFWQGRTFSDSGLRYAFPKREEYNCGSSDFLFGIDNIKSDELIICEGPFDAITINGVALGGKSLSSNQLKLIVRKGFKKIILAIDNDKAGYEMCDKVANQLRPYVDLVRYAIPEGGKDWNEIGFDKSKEILDNAKNYNISLVYKKKFGILGG
jgi:DNA primase